MLGPWFGAGNAEETVTFLKGLTDVLPGVDIVHARGVEVEGDDASGIGDALEACRDAEFVVMCLGESSDMSGEAASRARPDLPGRQRQLAESVLALGKPVVAVLSSGRPLTVSWLVERADAVLATWFLGSEAGHGLADILAGVANPTGRLPVSWPVEVGQVPLFYAQRPSGRPAQAKARYTSKYIDLPVTPLFPFGHGLSYTRFSLANLRADRAVLTPKHGVVFEVDVRNEGSRRGEETILLFVHDAVASVARPVMELKGLAKIELGPGERGTVRLPLTAEDLRFPGRDLAPTLEAGAIEILVGPCADRTKLVATTLRVETC
jgi:beta-glucosidase